MKDYLKMSNVFEGEIVVDSEGLTDYSGERFGEVEYRYSAHAINSHDELVTMNKELLAALGVIAASEEFHGDSFVCDFQTLQGVAHDAIAKAKGV